MQDCFCLPKGDGELSKRGQPCLALCWSSVKRSRFSTALPTAAPLQCLNFFCRLPLPWQCPLGQERHQLLGRQQLSCLSLPCRANWVPLGVNRQVQQPASKTCSLSKVLGWRGCFCCSGEEGHEPSLPHAAVGVAGKDLQALLPALLHEQPPASIQAAGTTRQSKRGDDCPRADLKMVLGSQILESFSQCLWAWEKRSECK